MNFKNLLTLSFIFFSLWGQSRVDVFSRAEIRFLEGLSPQVAPEIFPYEGIKINRNSSYPTSLYQKKRAIMSYSNNNARLRQALLYQRNGNIESFSEILDDLILEFNYSLLAPEAAILLGNFESLIYNQERALLYYLYIVNNHFNSPFGWEAYYKLGLTLSKKQNFVEAEKVMAEILKFPQNPFYLKAREFLEARYLLLSKVAFQNEDFKEARKYLDKYNETKALSAGN